MASSVEAAGEPVPTSAVLMSASKHIAVRCRGENVAFLKCKKDDPNPEKCLEKGRQVTRCVLSLLYIKEMSDLKKNGAWKLVDLSVAWVALVATCKLLYAFKLDPHGLLAQFRVRLVR